MGASAPVKYHFFDCFFTYSMKRGWILGPTSCLKVPAGRPGLKTLSGGEFGWGGTSVKP